MITKIWNAALRIKNILSREVLVFYWRGARDSNFGDQLNVDLFKHFGFLPVHSASGQAEVFSIGSIMHFYHDRYDGIILGSGHMQPPPNKNFRRGTILALRGPKTNLYEGQRDIPLCDPGILAKRMFGTPEKRWRFGIVPHFRDQDDQNLKIFLETNKDVKVIDVLRKPFFVVNEIAQCEMIFSSSLHGLVVADSYNIPAVWINFADRQTGGEFKFSDFHESLGIKRERITIHGATAIEELSKFAVKAPSVVTEAKMDDLERVFKTLKFHLAILRIKRIFRAVEKTFWH